MAKNGGKSTGGKSGATKGGPGTTTGGHRSGASTIKDGSKGGSGK